MSPYDREIEKRKAPKNLTVVTHIIKHIIICLQRGYSAAEAAAKLNTHKIYTITGRRWTANSLQMQIMRMARLDGDSSLAYGIRSMLRTGEATTDDYALMVGRCEDPVSLL